MTATVAIILALGMVFMLVLGVPIAIAIAISSVIAGGVALDFNMMLTTGAQRTFTGVSVFTLIAIPFFIFESTAAKTAAVFFVFMVIFTY